MSIFGYCLERYIIGFKMFWGVWFGFSKCCGNVIVKFSNSNGFIIIILIGLKVSVRLYIFVDV